MGYTSVLVVNNDFLGSLRNKSFLEVWNDACQTRLMGRFYASSTESRPVVMIWNDHRYYDALVHIGNCNGNILSTCPSDPGDRPEEAQLALLQVAAERLGYKLVRNEK